MSSVFSIISITVQYFPSFQLRLRLSDPFNSSSVFFIFAFELNIFHPFNSSSVFPILSIQEEYFLSFQFKWSIFHSFNSRRVFFIKLSISLALSSKGEELSSSDLSPELESSSGWEQVSCVHIAPLLPNCWNQTMKPTTSFCKITSCAPVFPKKTVER